MTPSTMLFKSALVVPHMALLNFRLSASSQSTFNRLMEEPSTDVVSKERKGWRGMESLPLGPDTTTWDLDLVKGMSSGPSSTATWTSGGRVMSRLPIFESAGDDVWNEEAVEEGEQDGKGEAPTSPSPFRVAVAGAENRGRASRARQQFNGRVIVDDADISPLLKEIKVGETAKRVWVLIKLAQDSKDHHKSTPRQSDHIGLAMGQMQLKQGLSVIDIGLFM